MSKTRYAKDQHRRALEVLVDKDGRWLGPNSCDGESEDIEGYLKAHGISRPTYKRALRRLRKAS